MWLTEIWEVKAVYLFSWCVAYCTYIPCGSLLSRFGTWLARCLAVRSVTSDPLYPLCYLFSGSVALESCSLVYKYAIIRSVVFHCPLSGVMHTIV